MAQPQMTEKLSNHPRALNQWARHMLDIAMGEVDDREQEWRVAKTRRQGDCHLVRLGARPAATRAALLHRRTGNVAIGAKHAAVAGFGF